MTTLVEEEPFAAVVDDDCISTTCANCFATTTPTGLAPIESFPCCLGCHIVHYCGRKCQKEDWKDHEVECKLLQKWPVPPNTNTRLVSRMILRAKREPDFKAFNGRTWNSLTDTVDIRMADANFRTNVAPCVFRMAKAFMGELTPSYDELVSAWGKMKTNCFTISSDDITTLTCGAGLYIGLSGLDHSCRPDCFYIEKGPKKILRTTKENMEYSDKLTINYIGWMLPSCTYLRRKALNFRFVFYCTCVECEDEKLDAKRQSGLCQFCLGWFPLNDPVCSDCGKTATVEQVEQVRDLNVNISAYLWEIVRGPKRRLRN